MIGTLFRIFLEFRFARALSGALLLLAGLVAGDAQAITSATNLGIRALQKQGICRQATYKVEKETGLPRMLLYAIALTETGKWDRATGESIAWPWTINARGRSHFYKSKVLAIAAVRRLQARGIRSIDVGCMQVNLRYHPDAFDSLDQAFDPRLNAAYAAKFLKQLHEKDRSWTVAIGHYHSHNRAKYKPYRRKVQRLWRAERRRVAIARRAAQRQIRARPVALR